jgi:hypothetical protein
MPYGKNFPPPGNFCPVRRDLPTIANSAGGFAKASARTFLFRMNEVREICRVNGYTIDLRLAPGIAMPVRRTSKKAH